MLLAEYEAEAISYYSAVGREKDAEGSWNYSNTSFFSIIMA